MPARNPDGREEAERLERVGGAAADAAQGLTKSKKATEDETDARKKATKSTKSMATSLRQYSNALGLTGALTAGVRGLSTSNATFSDSVTNSAVNAFSSITDVGALEIAATQRAGAQTFSFYEDAVRAGYKPSPEEMQATRDVLTERENRLIPFQREFNAQQTVAENRAFANAGGVGATLDYIANTLEQIKNAMGGGR